MSVYQVWHLQSGSMVYAADEWKDPATRATNFVHVADVECNHYLEAVRITRTDHPELGNWISNPQVVNLPTPGYRARDTTRGDVVVCPDGTAQVITQVSRPRVDFELTPVVA